MPGPKPKASLIPKSAGFKTIADDDLIEIRKAARLAGIHPVILEMGQRLLKRVGGEGAVFRLGSPELKAKAEEIRQEFLAGLRKVGLAWGPSNLQVRAHMDGDCITCWYDMPRPLKKKGKA